MEIETLSKKYGEFYAPAFTVRVGERDLVTGFHTAVSQVEVDLQLGSASRFSFTVADSYGYDRDGDRAFLSGSGKDLLELLEFGAEVTVSIGYGDRSKTPVAMRGLVTEISTNFPENGSPELIVSGYDHGFLLTMGKNSFPWTKSRDSDAAHSIASKNNLGAVIERTEIEHPQIEQNQESDWEFLKKLAERNHFELYVDEDKRLHFAAPRDDSEPVVHLAYGEGLLSFKPEANLAGQVSRVEVRGWDTNGKQAFVGVATAGGESGLKGTSAGQLLRNFIRDPKRQATLRLRQPVFTQAEADGRAKAALNERAKKFLTGDGESIGLPEIRPDTKIKLSRLGGRFSKVYYIQQATHKIDSSGYRTRFKVKEPGVQK